MPVYRLADLPKQPHRRPTTPPPSKDKPVGKRPPHRNGLVARVKQIISRGIHRGR